MCIYESLFSGVGRVLKFCLLGVFCIFVWCGGFFHVCFTFSML